MQLDVLRVEHAAGLLCDLANDQDQEAARNLAQELGQLPLALEQAAAYAAETDIALAEYLSIFREARATLLGARSNVVSGSVAATVTLTIRNLARSSPTALRLLEVCSLCSSDSLPLKSFVGAIHAIDDVHARELDAAERLAVLGALRQSGMFTVDGPDSVRLHRLTRVVIEDQIEDYRQRVLDAIAILFVLFPKRPSEPDTWSTCAGLAPHAISVLVHARRLSVASVPHAALLTRVGRYFLCSGLSFKDALQLHEEALRMREKLHDGDHPETARGLVHLAVDLNELGERERARQLHEMALAMRRRLYSQDHPDIAHSLDNLGNVLHGMGRQEEARSYHEQGLAMRQRLYPDDHPNVAYSLSNLATDLHELGRLDEARSLNEAALEMRRRIEPGDHPDTVHSLTNLAHDLRSLGRRDESRQLTERALAMQQRLYPSSHPSALHNADVLVDDCLALGDLTGAANFKRLARELRESAGCGNTTELV
jgi:tetratricopeptide (TPR) repeat protein